MARPAIKPHHQETVELIEKLKEKLSCETDERLAEVLEIHCSMISRWRSTGMPHVTRKFAELAVKI